MPNSAKYRHTPISSYRPLQLRVELHQKDLRINHVLVQIWGMVLDPVLVGGHVPGLKSNRRLFGVQLAEKAPTCRHSSQTAVQKSQYLVKCP